MDMGFTSPSYADDDISYNHVSHDEVSHDYYFSHDEASYDALSHDDVSHDEASHDALTSFHEAFFHPPAASFLYDPNNHRRSVMQLTGVSDDLKVGHLLVRGDKRSMIPSSQYLDPLIGVLRYIAEVRLPVHNRLLYSYLASTKRTITTPWPRVPWPLPMMMIFGSSKGWYVQIKILQLN